VFEILFETPFSCFVLFLPVCDPRTGNPVSTAGTM